MKSVLDAYIMLGKLCWSSELPINQPRYVAKEKWPPTNKKMVVERIKGGLVKPSTRIRDSSFEFIQILLDIYRNISDRLMTVIELEL